ncbi:acyltransferase family protein [Paenibacillus sp. HJL G12]|uniref:Acyltransferase family protein n=1 Tax=Paenibacillus dendrobii TaxID=2691084 RepID=A0A7X3LGB2_9BACL|nr:acyltransferase [Paenibacillus dendrobii]MWV43942.1 acyltransferase family protein [Paenibacillus dendrobii]
MGKPRIEEWTQLRGLAFLAIVMQHSIAEYIYRADIEPADSIMLTMIYHLTRFGTPTFVFLSAVLMFYNHSRGLHYFQFIRKRLGDVYVPFLLWTLIYWLYVRVFTPAFWQKGGQDWSSFFKELLVPQTGYQLWFIIMIVQFYIFFPVMAVIYRFIRSRLELLNDRNRGLSVFSIMAGSGLVYIILLYLSYHVMGSWAVKLGSPWSDLIQYRSYSFLMYGFYIVIGAVCAAGVEKWRMWCTRLLPWSGLVFLGMYIKLGSDVLRGSGEVVNLNISTYLKPSTFIIIVAQMLLLYGLLIMMQGRSRMFLRLLAWIGKYSFGGYLIHALIIYVIAYFTRPMALEGSHVAFTLLTFVMTVIAALGISYTLSHMPGSRWTVGSRRNKQRKAVKESDFTKEAPALLSTNTGP